MAGSNNSQKSEVQEQKKLKELTAHLQSLITSLDDIIFEVDANQVFKNVWVSDESILFMPKAQFLGKKLIDVMGSDSDIYSNTIKEVVRTGVPCELVYPHPEKTSNQWFKVKVKPVIKSPDPEKYILILSIQDVTDQKLAELALQETKDKLEFTVQLLNVSQELNQTASWELNLLTNEVFCTNQAYELFELPEGFKFNFISTKPFFIKEDYEILIQAAQESVSKKKAYDLELRIITSNGVMKWVRATGIPVIKENVVIKLRGALMDITTKKQIEQELIDAKNEAVNAFKVKSDFLSIMSHEIRTPLNGIIGIANILKLDHTVAQTEYINSLMYSADHLLSLINDILDLTKIESNKLDLVSTEVNLSQLTDSIKNQFSTLADEKGIKLTSTLSGNIPQTVITDPVRLGQVLNNLLGNAVKFTEHGTVSLILELVSKDSMNASIKFTVKDTGMGIPENLQDSIFENFKQIQQSAYRKHTGSGLGLAITRKLLKLFGSNITLKSEPGLGTEFYFDISFKIPQKPKRFPNDSTLSGLSAEQKELSSMKALLVEDNMINMMVAKKQMEHFGLKPDSANNGHEALAFLEKNTYHVALLDLHMPEIDGYMLAKIIQEKYPEIHILIFTADIMAEVVARLAKMNIFDILSKPFDPEIMYNMLLKIALNKGLINED